MIQLPKFVEKNATNFETITLAEVIIAANDKDHSDKRLMSDTIRKVRKSLQTLERQGTVKSWREAKGCALWGLSSPAR